MSQSLTLRTIGVTNRPKPNIITTLPNCCQRTRLPVFPMWN